MMNLNIKIINCLFKEKKWMMKITKNLFACKSINLSMIFLLLLKEIKINNNNNSGIKIKIHGSLFKRVNAIMKIMNYKILLLLFHLNLLIKIILLLNI